MQKVQQEKINKQKFPLAPSSSTKGSKGTDSHQVHINKNM